MHGGSSANSPSPIMQPVVLLHSHDSTDCLEGSFAQIRMSCTHATSQPLYFERLVLYFIYTQLRPDLLPASCNPHYQYLTELTLVGAFISWLHHKSLISQSAKDG